MDISLRQMLRGSFAILLFLVVWEVFARPPLFSISLFPPPSRVVLAFVEMAKSGDLVRDMRSSIWRAIVGFGIGGSVGISVGLVTGRVPLANGFLSPLLNLFRPLPPVAIIPLVIVWFGIGEPSKVFSISFAVFFPVWISTHLGAEQVPNTFTWGAKTLGVSKTAMLWKVILPASLPSIVAGLRTGIAVAFVMVYVSELAGASSGIGYQISISHLAYRVDRMIAALVLLGFLGFLADNILTKVISWMYPWLRSSVGK